MSTIEEIYSHHHTKNRGNNCILLGDERGAFLRQRIGKGKRVLDIGCRDGALTALRERLSLASVEFAKRCDWTNVIKEYSVLYRSL